MLEKFSFANSCLCECVIECEIPLPVVNSATNSALLVAQLRLGSKAASGGLDDERLLLSLRVNERSIALRERAGGLKTNC
jgi:hypothetical protein